MSRSYMPRSSSKLIGLVFAVWAAVVVLYALTFQPFGSIISEVNSFERVYMLKLPDDSPLSRMTQKDDLLVL